MKTLSLRRSSPSSSSSTASQLGSQLWLIQRAELPSKLASITYSSLSVNRKVWPESTSPLSPASTSSCVRRRPLYSIRRSPFLIGATANMPLPWMLERRVAILRGMQGPAGREWRKGAIVLDTRGCRHRVEHDVEERGLRVLIRPDAVVGGLKPAGRLVV